jgi:hypothetical protein
MDLFDTTDLLLFNLMGQVGASRSALWLTSERDGALAVVRCHGFNRRLVNGAISSCRDDLLERIAERSTVPRVWMQVSELPEDSFMLIHQANIAVLAPLRTHGELIGWIALGTRVNRQPYGPAELDVLETALGMIAMALENTRLFNRVRETNRGLVAANEHLKELDRLKSEFLNNVNTSCARRWPWSTAPSRPCSKRPRSTRASGRCSRARADPRAISPRSSRTYCCGPSARAITCRLRWARVTCVTRSRPCIAPGCQASPRTYASSSSRSPTSSATRGSTALGSSRS